MNDLQRYALFGVALFAPIMALFWLDIWRARGDAAFRAAFPRRGRVGPVFWLLTAVEALLAGYFPAGLMLPARALVALAVVTASAAVGALLAAIIVRLPRET